ncbi:hypothetical protein V6N11_033123 [Hibiscus sabdariffa]|uniref:Uncharacterized protein n=1 Tax=Hibiscus sabdariffa TaxID=183260 RepID=A0ABR2A0Z9_9ROSI
MFPALTFFIISLMKRTSSSLSSKLSGFTGRELNWNMKEFASSGFVFRLSTRPKCNHTRASLILSQNPDCFLCNSELMYVDSRLPHVPKDEQLQPGQIYFLMPLSKSQATLSLQEPCSLAIKASEPLSHLNKVFSDQNVVRFVLDSIPQGDQTTKRLCSKS